MIKKIINLSLLVLIASCSNIELVLKESDSPNLLKDNVLFTVLGDERERFVSELYSVFGNNKDKDYILITSISEKKENRVVKKNQVAEKTDYELTVNYGLFYKNRACKILDKKIITKFTISPKSFGYNFGADMSFEKLYNSSIKKNIEMFVNTVPTSKNCLL